MAVMNPDLCKQVGIEAPQKHNRILHCILIRDFDIFIHLTAISSILCFVSLLSELFLMSLSLTTVRQCVQYFHLFRIVIQLLKLSQQMEFPSIQDCLSVQLFRSCF